VSLTPDVITVRRRGDGVHEQKGFTHRKGVLRGVLMIDDLSLSARQLLVQQERAVALPLTHLLSFPCVPLHIGGFIG
jgi:hypothetical protein